MVFCKIIMSATLRVSDFVDNKKLFAQPPPVISVEARQFPVTVHFNRRTVLGDYIGEAYKKVCKIHQRLPQGGILVFLTGQQEIEVLCRKLRAAFPPHMERRKRDIRIIKEEDNEAQHDKRKKQAKEDETPQANESKSDPKAEQDDQQEKKEAEIKYKIGEEEEEEEETIGPLWVLPLYSALPTKQQLQVFEPPPEVCLLLHLSKTVLAHCFPAGLPLGCCCN